MKEIKLNKGLVALVDDEDFEALSKFQWCAHVAKNKRLSYARCNTNYRGQKSVAMHRMIMGNPPSEGMVVDHINHNGLDNRRSNLRWATSSQNALNCHRVNRSGFRGVSEAGGRFEAQTAGRRIGWFKSAAEAAGAYNWCASRLYGEFAILNADASGTVIPEVRPNDRIAAAIEEKVRCGTVAAARGIHKWSLKPQMRPMRLRKDAMRNLSNRNGIWYLRKQVPGEKQRWVTLGTKELYLAQARRNRMEYDLEQAQPKVPVERRQRPRRYLIKRNGIWYYKRLLDGRQYFETLHTRELSVAKERRDQLERDRELKVQRAQQEIRDRQQRARQLLIDTADQRKQTYERRRALRLTKVRRTLWKCGHCGAQVANKEDHHCSAKTPVFTPVEMVFVT